MLLIGRLWHPDLLQPCNLHEYLVGIITRHSRLAQIALSAGDLNLYLYPFSYTKIGVCNQAP